VVSSPLIFLAWGDRSVYHYHAITLYSFRGFAVASPGMIRQSIADYTHWTVVGTMGVSLIISSLMCR